ncbi:divalent metal cation transporter [Paraglaciecola aquimarina]|uniref:Divalent metal cation transporter n=1 Tax=Paraglaciecola algarum TaxID=3050085 RepID=A0ABS9D568_9ALTE|nr:divalent metal cation transporter [Paraglaciecola sp. G1-23]MCF2947168.1 divalent metal cation transporter [Paraglaciecola sp. G1-23]
MSNSSEIATLQALSAKPWYARVPTYLKLSGPGWLQGAMTLGGGSAVTSLTIGALFGYELLWVQPVAMIIGCIMLFALSHQTLHTQDKPFEAMKKHVNAPIAWGWAIAAFASSIIWGFAHYPLSAAMLEEIIVVGTGFSVDKDSGTARDMYLLVLAIIIWAGVAFTAWKYGDHDNEGGKNNAVKYFENGIKILSGLIIIAFAWVVISASLNGKVDWAAVAAGYIPTSFPSDAQGVTIVMAALGSAVGINMTFIYGYTLLHKKWTKDHAELSRYDIGLGLVLPYFLVTSLISIAAAGAFFGSDLDIQGKLSPTQAGTMFMSAGLDEVTSRLIFAFGILGMAIGSLVMHMLCCGSAAAAMFGWEENSFKYKLALLAPTPAILGVFVWSTMGAYVVVPTAAICGFLLPIAYIGWALLNNRKDYLGEAMPTGTKRLFINIAMALCIVTVLASVVYSTLVKMGYI